MKSDVVTVASTGEGIEEALKAASSSARYRELEHKNALHLRLLAEETLGMARQMTGEVEAQFWVESEGTDFELHLVAHALVTGNMRKELLKVSTSGKNEAAKGFMGKLRDIFDRALASDDMGGLSDYYAQGFILPGDIYSPEPMTVAISPRVMTWSMNKYRDSVEGEKSENAEAKEKWDELERSIVASIADEIRIAITGDKVEMIVYKKFSK